MVSPPSLLPPDILNFPTHPIQNPFFFSHNRIQMSIVELNNNNNNNSSRNSNIIKNKHERIKIEKYKRHQRKITKVHIFFRDAYICMHRYLIN